MTHQVGTFRYPDLDARRPVCVGDVFDVEAEWDLFEGPIRGRMSVEERSVLFEEERPDGHVGTLIEMSLKGLARATGLAVRNGTSELQEYVPAIFEMY